MKIFSKLLLLNIILGILPLIGVIFFSSYMGKSMMTGYLEKQVQREVEIIGQKLSSFFEQRKVIISTLSQVPILKDSNWEEIGPYLQSEQTRLSPYFEKFIYGLPSGHFYNTTGGNPYLGGKQSHDNQSPNSEPKNISKRMYWAKTIRQKSDTPYISEPMISYTTGVRQIVIAESIIKNDSVVAMIGGAIPWSMIHQLVTEIKTNLDQFIDGNIQFSLVSNDGVFIYHWDPSKHLKYVKHPDGTLKLNQINEPIVISSRLQDQKEPFFLKAYQAISQQKSYAGYVIQEDAKSYMNFLPIQGTNYTIGMKVPSVVFNRHIDTIIQQAILIGAIGLILIGFTSYFFSNSFTKRIVQLDKAIRTFIQGHHYSKISERGNDEVAMLSKSFNIMAQEVKKQIEIITQNEMKLLEHKNNLESEVELQTKNLMEERDRAQNLAQVKSDFLANMSHEIRTPLNAIVGFSSNLLESIQDPEQLDQLATLHSASNSLMAIVNDILDFSKIEQDKLKIEPHVFNLAKLVDDVIKINELRADERGLLFKSSIPHLKHNLIGDSLRIRQILMNFLSNAIKFCDKGEIQIAIHKLEELDKHIRLRFEVIDSGVGISEKHLQRIFNRFEQEDTSTTRKFGGTGLGLSICESLCGLMGGTIGVKSTQGEGSTFWIELNFEKTEESLTNSSHLEHKQTFEGRVLLVDDNTINLKVGRMILKKKGLEVLEANSGQEALDILEKDQNFDIIFMDCQMPGMDGFEATEMINKLYPTKKMKIIALTANVLNDIKDQIHGSGFDGYLAKPIENHALQKILNTHLSSGATENQ